MYSDNVIEKNVFLVMVLQVFVVMASHVFAYVQTHQNVHVKYVQFSYINYKLRLEPPTNEYRAHSVSSSMLIALKKKKNIRGIQSKLQTTHHIN